MIISNDAQKIGMWLANKQNKKYYQNDSAVYIAWEHNKQIKAAVMFDNYIENGSIEMHLSIDGFGNKKLLHLAYHYPFEQLKIKKIIAKIYSSNEKCLKLALKAGFILEHTIKEAGINCDLLILTMTKKQCRFLK